MEITTKTFEDFRWEILYYDDNQIEAKRHNEFVSNTHKVTAKVNHLVNVEVISESLGNEMWDVEKCIRA